MLCIFGSNGLYLHFESIKWYNYCYFCRIGRIFFDSQCFSLSCLFSWSDFPNWRRICRRIFVCCWSNIWCCFGGCCDYCFGWNSTITFTNLSCCVWNSDHTFILLYCGHKRRFKTSQIRIIEKIINWRFRIRNNLRGKSIKW